MSGRPISLVVAALLVLVGCNGTDDGAPNARPGTATSTTKGGTGATGAPPTSAAPTLNGAPGVGACLEPMTQPLASGHHLPDVIDCEQPHGGEVVAVYEIETGADGAYPAAGFDLVGVGAQLKRCTGDESNDGDVASYVGRQQVPITDAQRDATGVTAAYRVSGVQYAVFVPGPAAWQRGERWFACAAVLSNSRLAPSAYSGSLRDALADPAQVPDELAWCKNQSSDTRGDFVAVPCTEPHNYEQVVAFDAGSADSPDPGEAALEELASTLCPPLSSTASNGRTDDLDASLGLGWTYPLPSEWSNGDRTVRCFAVTLDGATTVGSAVSGTARPG